MEGQVIGSYRVLGLIGQGGSAKVYSSGAPGGAAGAHKTDMVRPARALAAAPPERPCDRRSAASCCSDCPVAEPPQTGLESLAPVPGDDALPRWHVATIGRTGERAAPPAPRSRRARRDTPHTERELVAMPRVR
jgi:hypothetical protein